MIAWVDTETTGLDPENGDLLEVALVITDDQLENFRCTSVLVQPPWGLPSGFDKMIASCDPVVREMHEKSGGLWAELREGRGLSRMEAEERLYQFVSDFFMRDAKEMRSTPLAGSTVSFDRAWLKRHMPTLEALFSYRSVDVSSLTELAKRWAPAVYEGRPKKDPDKIAHRALADARESVRILQYYRACGFVGGNL